ncbi:MAG: hypothetical protein R3A11_08290 [Bdellovibrionota bacterium]
MKNISMIVLMWAWLVAGSSSVAFGQGWFANAEKSLAAKVSIEKDQFFGSVLFYKLENGEIQDQNQATLFLVREDINKPVFQVSSFMVKQNASPETRALNFATEVILGKKTLILSNPQNITAQGWNSIEEPALQGGDLANLVENDLFSSFYVITNDTDSRKKGSAQECGNFFEQANQWIRDHVESIWISPDSTTVMVHKEHADRAYSFFKPQGRGILFELDASVATSLGWKVVLHFEESEPGAYEYVSIGIGDGASCSLITKHSIQWMKN